MGEKRKTALSLPETNPMCFDIPYEDVSNLLNGLNSSSKEENLSKDTAFRSTETEVDKLIKKMPSIAKSSGYSLLSKLFEIWLNPSRLSNEIEIPWSYITNADDFSVIKNHMQVAKTALEFSLIPLENLKVPNLAGIGPDFSNELNKLLNNFLSLKDTPSMELSLPVYTIYMDSMSFAINNAIMERLIATRSKLTEDIDIRKYNEVFNLNIHAHDPISIPIKSIRLENLKIIVQVSELIAALGRFKLNVHLRINATKTEKGLVSWYATKIIYKIKDIFNFNDNDYLGHWDVKGLGYGYPMGIKLNDELLRDFGKKHQLKDVEFYSEVTEDLDSIEFLYRKNTPTQRN